MQIGVEPKHVHLGILPLQSELLEEMLCLPTGYHIVNVSYDEMHSIVNLTLWSEQLPESEMNAPLPQLALLCHREVITTEVKVL